MLIIVNGEIRILVNHGFSGRIHYEYVKHRCEEIGEVYSSVWLFQRCTVVVTVTNTIYVFSVNDNLKNEPLNHTISHDPIRLDDKGKIISVDVSSKFFNHLVVLADDGLVHVVLVKQPLSKISADASLTERSILTNENYYSSPRTLEITERIVKIQPNGRLVTENSYYRTLIVTRLSYTVSVPSKNKILNSAYVTTNQYLIVVNLDHEGRLEAVAISRGYQHLGPQILTLSEIGVVREMFVIEDVPYFINYDGNLFWYDAELNKMVPMMVPSPIMAATTVNNTLLAIHEDGKVRRIVRYTSPLGPAAQFGCCTYSIPDVTTNDLIILPNTTPQITRGRSMKRAL